jgi:uncharacterized protein (TIGR02118 family)
MATPRLIIESSSQEQLQRSLSSPEGQAVVADLPNFASGGVTILVSEVQDTERTASPLGQQVASSRA